MGIRSALLALGLLAAAPPAPGQQGDAAPRPLLERAGLLELTLPAPTGVRSEWFRIDAPPANALTEDGSEGVSDDKSKAAEPLGLVRLLRLPQDDGSIRLESETLFFDVATRVAHVERLALASLDLVWRELGRDHGRTVHVSWDRDAEGLRLTDAAGGAVRRRVVRAAEGALMPLFLLEKQRAGALSDGVFRRLDPNAGTVETLTHRAWPAPPAGPFGRLHAWEREDGSLAGRYLFRGSRLLAFQLQEGGPVARAVPRAEYDRLRARIWAVAKAR